MELPTQHTSWHFPPLDVGFPSYDADLPLHRTDFSLLTEADFPSPNVDFGTSVDKAAYPLGAMEFTSSYQPPLLESLDPSFLSSSSSFSGQQPTSAPLKDAYHPMPSFAEYPDYHPPMIATGSLSYIGSAPNPEPAVLQENVSIDQADGRRTPTVVPHPNSSLSSMTNTVPHTPAPQITIQPVKLSAKVRNALTAEQKKLAVKERQGKKAAIEEDVNDLFLYIQQRCNELGDKHNRKARFFLDRIFNGGVKSVTGSKTSSFNAWAHFKCEQINEGTYIQVVVFVWPWMTDLWHRAPSRPSGLLIERAGEVRG